MLTFPENKFGRLGGLVILATLNYEAGFYLLFLVCLTHTLVVIYGVRKYFGTTLSYAQKFISCYQMGIDVGKS